MADSTDLERLVVALEAQSVKLDRAISATAANVDKQLGAMEKRTELLRTRMESSFANAGANSLKKFANALLATGAFVAIERFVSSIVEKAEAISHTAAAIGVGASDLQAWGIAALKAGVNQEDFNNGLDRFAKNVGSAALGNKQLRAEFDRMRIDIKGGVTPAFLQFADVVKNARTQTEQVSLVTALFGRGMANLTPFIALGSEKIKELTQNLKDQGRVISDENLAKIDEMANKWRDLKQQLQVAGANALAGFFETFGKFADQLQSSEFQTALKNFGTVMGEVAAFAVKLAPLLPEITGALIGGKIGGAPGAAIGAAVGLGLQLQNQRNTLEENRTELKDLEDRWRGAGSDLFGKIIPDRIQSRIDELRRVIAEQSRPGPPQVPAGLRPKPGAGSPTAEDIFAPAGPSAADIAKRLAAEAQQRADALAHILVEQARANEQAVAADDQMHVRMLQGLAGYHAAVIKEIDDELAAKTNQINEEEQAALVALGRQKGLTGQQLQAELDAIHETAAARRSAADADAQLKLFEASSGEVVRNAIAQAEDQIRGYDTETKSLGLLGGELARVQFLQAAYNDAKAKGITLSEEDVKRLNAEADALAASAQKAHDAARAMQDNIAIADEFRTGLIDVFAAGLKGWKAMEQAAGNFLQQLAESILKTQVLKPLVENLFGEQGGPLGGIIGAALGLNTKPDGTEANPVNVKVVNGGSSTTGTGNPIADLIKDIGQTGGPNLSNNASLPSTSGSDLTGEINTALTDSFEQGGKTAASSLTNALDTGGKSLGDVLMSVFKSGGDLLSTIFNGLGSLLGGGGGGGGLGGILGSLFGGGGGDLLGSLFGGAAGASGFSAGDIALAGLGFFAEGGVMTNKGPLKLRSYAGGGIANSPQLAQFGEGDGPEAFVPLKGGAIPVQFKAPVAKTQPIVNVYQTVHADRSILADDILRKIDRSKNEAIDIASRSGAALALRAQPGRQEQFRKLGT